MLIRIIKNSVQFVKDPKNQAHTANLQHLSVACCQLSVGFLGQSSKIKFWFLQARSRADKSNVSKSHKKIQGSAIDFSCQDQSKCWNAETPRFFFFASISINAKKFELNAIEQKIFFSDLQKLFNKWPIGFYLTPVLFSIQRWTIFQRHNWNSIFDEKPFESFEQRRQPQSDPKCCAALDTCNERTGEREWVRARAWVPLRVGRLLLLLLLASFVFLRQKR